jgi:hypothetical protein
MMWRLKKRKINRGEFDAFRSGRAQKAPGKRTHTEERYRKAELAEEVPQQVDPKAAPAKRDANKPDPNKAEGTGAADPALAQPQPETEIKPDVTPEKELAPSFLPVFDAEPDAEKE